MTIDLSAVRKFTKSQERLKISQWAACTSEEESFWRTLCTKHKGWSTGCLMLESRSHHLLAGVFLCKSCHLCDSVSSSEKMETSDLPQRPPHLQHLCYHPQRVQIVKRKRKTLPHASQYPCLDFPLITETQLCVRLATCPVQCSLSQPPLQKPCDLVLASDAQAKICGEERKFGGKLLLSWKRRNRGW